MTSPYPKQDRRSFLVQAGWLMGTGAVAGAFPFPPLAATPACRVDASRYPDACGDWTVDHVCSHWPPYAWHTGPLPAHTVPNPAVADVDRHWVG